MSGPFAPAYRPVKQQQQQASRLHTQRHEAKKRKKSRDSSDEDDGPHSSTRDSILEVDGRLSTATTAFHPVNRKDPYHVAGHPREERLPPSPFPHAATKDGAKKDATVEEELAALHPPLLMNNVGSNEAATSLRRRHLDNLTTLMHHSILKGDWGRASRAWALLIRTEVNGQSIDIRRNDRWGIGAEVLMRRHTAQVPREKNTDEPTVVAESDSGDSHLQRQPRAADLSIEKTAQFSTEGFKLARDYYDRLILQYPYTARTQHLLNATAFYPSLFNIWVYEVQDCFKQARRKSEHPSPSNTDLSPGSIVSGRTAASNFTSTELVEQELVQARAIAQRMDDLLSSPPHDTDPTLIGLRASVALWIAHLHMKLARNLDQPTSNDASPVYRGTGGGDSERHSTESRNERSVAAKLYGRLRRSGVELSDLEKEILEDG